MQITEATLHMRQVYKGYAWKQREKIYARMWVCAAELEGVTW